MRKGSIVRTFLPAAAVLLALGCSSSANTGALPFNPATGQHPANWQTVHWSGYIQDPGQCETCHGTAAAAPAAAPLSGVTCFGCHHPNGPNHPADWNQPADGVPGDAPTHGLTAIAAASATFNPAAPDQSAYGGFATCTPCHGALYNNAAGTYAPSCYSCHTTAPHPPAPWGAGLGLPATQSTHDQVDPSNAPECAKCHTGGANSTITPVSPAAPGTAPGCFNGTLCHNTRFS
jgi:hypothetical protein